MYFWMLLQSSVLYSQRKLFCKIISNHKPFWKREKNEKMVIKDFKEAVTRKKLPKFTGEQLRSSPFLN